MANKSVIYIGVSLIAVITVMTYLSQNNTAAPLIDVTNAEMVQTGKELYFYHCSECHGKNLEGETPNWRDFKEDGTLPAPPHDKTGHTWHHDDQTLFDYTKKGGAAMVPKGFKSAMPGYGKILTDLEIRSILSYIKSTWPQEIQEKQSQRNRHDT